MQSLQTEKPRIENQFNQPLSMSVIFLPSLFHQLPPLLLVRSWLSHRGGKNGMRRQAGRTGRGADRVCMAGKSSSLAFLPGIHCRFIC